jgi:hypothetical protein
LELQGFPCTLDPPSILGLHEFVETKMSGYSRNFAVTTTPSAYLNFLNKSKTPFECKCQIGLVIFRFFIDAGENLVMADDVATPSNPPVTPVEKEKLEDAPLDETPFDEAP